MHNSSVLQLSTALEMKPDQWWRAAITTKDWLEARELLRQHTPTPTDMLGFTIPVTIARGLPWSRRVVWDQTSCYPHVLLWLGEPYRVGDLYDLSRKKNDPYLNPYGAFAKLKHGDPRHAFEFLESFGPLWVPDRNHEYACWIDLNRFWAHHRRFLVLCELWENQNNAGRLQSVWEGIRHHLAAINAGGSTPFGATRDYVCGGFQNRTLPFPWEIHSDDFDSAALKQLSIEFVRRELMLHTHDCVPTWSVDKENGNLTLRPDRFYTSLWGAIWDLLGRDIWQRRPMLACKQCGRLFYPRRSDSTCCSPTHQVLWSKRAYARRKRYEAKEKALRHPQPAHRKPKRRGQYENEMGLGG